MLFLSYQHWHIFLYHDCSPISHKHYCSICHKEAGDPCSRVRFKHSIQNNGCRMTHRRMEKHNA